MIRVDSTGLGLNRISYCPKSIGNNWCQGLPLLSSDNFERQGDMSFGAKLPRTRIIKKFLPSEKRIASKGLSLNIKKTLEDGTAVETTFKNGKKTFELKTTKDNVYSATEYDQNGKLIQATTEYYDKNNQLLKDELIDERGNLHVKEYLPGSKLNKACTSYFNGTTGTLYYDGNGKPLKLVYEFKDGSSVTKRYDVNGVIREKTVKTKNKIELYKYDDKEKLITLDIKIIEEDGSIIKSTYGPNLTPIKARRDSKDGTFLQLEFKDGILSKTIEKNKIGRDKEITTQLKYNDKEEIIQSWEKHSNGTEYIDDFSSDGKKIVSSTKILKMPDGTEMREEIFYNEAQKKDYGTVYFDGEITYHFKFDSNGILSEMKDTDGNSVPIEAASIFVEGKRIAPDKKNQWSKFNSIKEVIPNLGIFNRIHSN